MLSVQNKIQVVPDSRWDELKFDDLVSAGRPVVLQGLARDWGLVSAGRASEQAAMEYLLSFYNGKSLSASFAKPDAGGRLFLRDRLCEAQLRTDASRCPRCSTSSGHT